MQLQISKNSYLARRMEGTSARLDLEEDQKSAHAEILRCGWLKSAIKSFKHLARTEQVNHNGKT